MLAAVGNLALDVVAGGPPRPGGPVRYSALTLARLDAEARIGASCAAEHREALVAPLETLGLEVHWHESPTTAGYAFRYEGDRRVMEQTAVGGTWTPEQAVAVAAGADWVHVGALVRSDFPAETLAALADGHHLLVDAQGLVRRPVLGALRTDGEIGDALRHVDALKLDEEEADALAGTREPESLRRLGVAEVLLTLGSRGSVVVTESCVERVAAEAVADEVDPTGSGDSFCAAYVAARADGAEPVEAARFATATVARFLSASGT